MQQIAVRGVDLDAVEAEPCGALGRTGEVVAHLLQARVVERDRRLLARRMRHGRRRHRLPRARLAERHLQAAVPRRTARRLAAGVRQLHAELDRRVRAHRAEHACQRLFVVVRVEAEIAGRDAPFGRDRRGLDDQQARAREREVAEMDQVPVARRPFARRVLAHRRDDDAVGQRQVADAKGLEESAHGIRCSVGVSMLTWTRRMRSTAG